MTGEHAGVVGYRALTSAIIVSHFAFVAYVVLGGFLAWRWGWAIVPHLLAVAWGFLLVALSLDCPLTAAENWSRARSGEAPVASGFIGRYLTGVLYPARYLHEVQVLVAVVVLVSWVGLVLRWRGARG